jgi:hypothetical protein
MGAMRFAALLLSVLLTSGCAVPEVSFYGADATDNADASNVTDGERPGSDARPDVGDAGVADVQSYALTDGRSDAPEGGGDAGYCVGPDGGVRPPNGLACCPGGQGEACAGECKTKACTACLPCMWPMVCCTNGNNGVCKPYC